jgi:hypothetical protein
MIYPHDLHKLNVAPDTASTKAERVFDAFRDRHPERAHENMTQLVKGMRKFPERELAGLLHDGAERARTATR